MLCKKTFRWVSFCGRRGWTWSKGRQKIRIFAAVTYNI